MKATTNPGATRATTAAKAAPTDSETRVPGDTGWLARVQRLEGILEDIEAMAVECWICEGSGKKRSSDDCCEQCGGLGKAWEVPSAALAEIIAAVAETHAFSEPKAVLS